MKNYRLILATISASVVYSIGFADGDAGIAKQKEIEGRRIGHSCQDAADFQSCLVENGFKCEAVADAGADSYFCTKDAPPGHFEVYWNRDSDANGALVQFIDDRATR